MGDTLGVESRGDTTLQVREVGERGEVAGGTLARLRGSLGRRGAPTCPDCGDSPQEESVVQDFRGDEGPGDAKVAAPALASVSPGTRRAEGSRGGVSRGWG